MNKIISASNYDAYLNQPASSAPPEDDGAPIRYPQLDPEYYFEPAPPPYDSIQQDEIAPPNLPYPQPLLTQAVHQKTLEFLSIANEQAATILNRKRIAPPIYNPQAAAPQLVRQTPAVHIDLADRSWRMFNNETHVHHHHENEPSKEKQKDQTGLRILVGVIGLTVAFATAFFVGKAVAAREDAQEETMSFAELKTEWMGNKSLYHSSYSSIVDQIAGRMDSILERQATQRVHKIALLGFAFMAGGSAFVGALAASKLLMTAGAIVGSCTAAVALYKLGYSYVSRGESKDAAAIEKALIKLDDLEPLVV